MASGQGSASRQVWARVECIVRGYRGPYHWTEDCLSRAESLVAIDRDRAAAMSNLRPCKLCTSRRRR
ncbi:MAG TPA: hypothetical protein VN615_11490 [Gaiellales bacterium]|nr:hypothetical protein [Gaiellales bacterium]